MAEVITITKDDTTESIQKKLEELSAKAITTGKGFDAKKYTGKIKSFGPGLDYQRKIRNEWR